MPYNIIIGRDEADKALFGEKGTVFLGRHYVKMGQTTSLSNNIFLDITKTHVILITGKRGYGKSYSVSVIAEEISRLPEEISKNLSVILFDTMGIFWTMKFPNTRQESLLKEWGLESEALDVSVYTPKGFFMEYKENGIPTDYSFAIKTSELSASDWADVFEIKLTSSLGIVISRAIETLEEISTSYSIDEIIQIIRDDKKSEQRIKDAAETRFLAAKKWGLFEKEGTEIKDIVKPGKVSVMDLSVYTSVSGSWSIKALVAGFIARKLLVERTYSRKFEELNSVRSEEHYQSEKEEMPLVWLLVDEAHNLIPKDARTPATDAFVQLLREGRQPGISLILATQQPGAIHRDVLTQSDIIISHRVTSKIDIEALNSMMQSYLITDIQRYLNDLPKLKGSAIILDDNSERIYPMMVHPKRSWHGGEAPSAIKIKKEIGLSI